MDFKVDPNGFVVPVPPVPRAQRDSEAAARAAAAAALEASASGLGGRLAATAAGGANGANGAAAAAADAAAATDAAAASTAPSVPSDPAAAAAKADFLRRHGARYGYGGRIDALYPSEVGSRMRPHERYLDYTGSSVYANSQIDAVFAELKGHLFGNPHSANPSSSFASDRVEEARDIVLR